MVDFIELTFQGFEELTREAKAISLSYASFIEKAKFINYKRINIDVVDSQEGSVEITRDALKILTIEIKYNMSSYLQKDDNSKRKILYELLFYCMDHLASKKDWDHKFFDQIKAEIVQRSYIVYIPYLKLVKNRKKKVSAQLAVLHDFKFGDLKLNVYDSNNSVVKTVDVMKVYPHPFIYSWILSKVSWFNEAVFRISDPRDEIHTDINIEEDSVTTQLEPKQNSLEVLQQHILAIDPSTPETERRKYIQQQFQLPR